MSRSMLVGILALIAILIASSAMFTVRENERAIMFRYGEVVGYDYQPGLHWKYPLVNNIRKFDARVLTASISNERFLTSEKKNVIVDAFIKWRIADLRQFYTSTSGDQFQASSKLIEIIKDGLRSQFGKRTVKEVVSGERREIMVEITRNSKDDAAQLGVEIVDVRMTAIDLPPEATNSVYARMRAERQEVASELRSRGDAAATEIKARAERDRTVLLAGARRESQQTRGEGDATATKLYAESYNQDAEFYAFYRSLDAYKSSFGGSGDMLVIKPDSEFFKYFNGADLNR